jgi:carbon storage regulator
MLIITRKVGEEIVVGGNVHIRALKISGSRVRLGIDAPREMPVHREEIFTAQWQFTPRSDLPSSPAVRGNAGRNPNSA